MTIYGRVIDNSRKGSIEGATINIVDETGKPVAGPYFTNNVGAFTINSPAITLQSLLEISHPNFYPKEVAISGSSSLGFIVLEPMPVVQQMAPPMPDVSLKEEGEKSGGSNYWWLLLVGAWLLWPKPKGGRRSKK